MILAFRLSTLSFGGAERVFISVADYLAKTHHVKIHFVVDSSVSGGTEDVAREHGFEIFNLNCHRTLRSIIPFRKYIDNNKPDILISAYTDTNFAAIISAQLATHKCVTVVSEHASLDEHWKNFSLKRRFLLNTYVKFGYRFADHVLAVSKGISGQVSLRLPNAKNVSFIHNPIRFKTTLEDAFLVPTMHSGVYTILAVGRITKAKNYLNLLKAFKLVSQQLNCRLLIVGGIHEHEEKSRLDEFINSNNLGLKVEFIGFTDHVEKYYRRADVFVLSSAWEGFGNVIVEAMAFGIPVVSTNCNHGPSEILCDGQYGKLVPVGDSLALADAISDVLKTVTHDKLQLQKRAEDFSEERIGEKYWILIQQLLEVK